MTHTMNEHRTQIKNRHITQIKNRHRTRTTNKHTTHAINEQQTVITFALILEAGYEQRKSHNVRTPLGALDAPYLSLNIVNYHQIPSLETKTPNFDTYAMARALVSGGCMPYRERPARLISRPPPLHRAGLVTFDLSALAEIDGSRLGQLFLAHVHVVGLRAAGAAG